MSVHSRDIVRVFSRYCRVIAGRFSEHCREILGVFSGASRGLLGVILDNTRGYIGVLSWFCRGYIRGLSGFSRGNPIQYSRVYRRQHVLFTIVYPFFSFCALRFQRRVPKGLRFLLVASAASLSFFVVALFELKKMHETNETNETNAVLLLIDTQPTA